MNLTLIIPVAYLDGANTIGEIMGWGPNSFSVPLSADGADPATHYALHLARANAEFLSTLQSAGAGQMPEALADRDFSPVTFAGVMQNLISGSVEPFDDVCAIRGLQRVEVA